MTSPKTSPRRWPPTRRRPRSSTRWRSFYRKAYLRWIDGTKGKPDVRAARIAEVVGLLADGVKERPRP
ncbi:YdeI/OmpD-associated family protein [Amycolatopsis sp. WQ 127309]|uniref:YdeI/OmpD-associated family protein n=1 Tax=Amycolatopsis sp. WQ 127309 TaxID=2932773 RepID=UPI001FF1007D|nr:YdeI/OmpD-associated family protein [Amycolatopsis sp. WQ 127309]UOZ12058.1 YdeI/OmpD-associated family protein [Amycolatopsis sp. WQ 127309]